MLLLPLVAFGLTLFLHVLAVNIFPRLKLLDFPERYGLKRRRLPYPTGIIASFVFLPFFLFLHVWNLQLAGIFSAIVLLSFFSFLDDRTPLPPLLRLSVQVLVGVVVFATGDCLGNWICSVRNPLSGILGESIIELNTLPLSLPLLPSFPLPSLLVTVLWLLLTMNALNWFDGIPGQVNTIASLGFLVLGVLALREGVSQPEVASIAFVLLGIVAASLLFDVPPPRVVMGDSGAMFLGLMLGLLAIFAGGKLATAFLVLGVPLIDSFIVILRRVLQGSNPLHGSLSGEHLHHLLREKGWGDQQIILLTFALGSLFGLAALLLATQGKFLAALLLSALVAGLHLYAQRK